MLLANGHKIFTKGIVNNLSFMLNNEKHFRNFFVIDMRKKHFILAMDWLGYSHALIDCENGALVSNKPDQKNSTIQCKKRNSELLLLFAMTLQRDLGKGAKLFLFFPLH